jgi:phosphoglycerate dehydrogenase-like enzyme
LGFGHIAKTLAHRAKAFGMRVAVANRSPVQSTNVDASFGLDNLKNVVMTPHMSGWTEGTVQRRKQTIADNINRLWAGEALLNVLSD